MSLFNRRHVQQHFSQAAQNYNEAAVLQKQLADELDERLSLINHPIKQALDLGCGTGFVTQKLVARYPEAQCYALDLSASMLQLNRNALLAPRISWLPQRLSARLGWLHCPVDLLQADAHAIPLASSSVDLVLSNLMLQWCDDLDAVFAEVARILKPGGLFMFTSLGPDTLKELRQAWVEVEGEDGHLRMNEFVDMHDLGDALIRAGLGQPVMDIEHFTLTYTTPLAVIKDLKAIGATNAHKTRPQGLTGKNRFAAMLNAYETLRVQNKIPATYEVVHGHAWANREVFKGPNRNKQGVHEITLEQFQQQVKSKE